MDTSSNVEIKDVYFRRFFVPIVITILLFVAIAAILYNVPGTPPKWDTYSSAFGAQMGGLFRRR